MSANTPGVAALAAKRRRLGRLEQTILRGRGLMTHMSRVIRRPLAVAAAGGLLGVLGLGGSALAAAPKTQHRHATHHHAAKHHGRDRGRGHGPATAATGASPAHPGTPAQSPASRAVNLYTLTSSGGMQVKISNYGGVVQSIWVPDRSGHLTTSRSASRICSTTYDDFTQGATGTPFPAAGGSGDTYFGAIIGRYANRIGRHRSTSTATRTSSMPTTAPTRCTAATWAGTRMSGPRARRPPATDPCRCC